MSAAIIYQAAMAYDMSNTRALAAHFEDGVDVFWLPDDGRYPWIPKRGDV